MIEVKRYTRTEFPTALFLKLTADVYGSERIDKLPKCEDYQGDSYFLFENDHVVATATVYINPTMSSSESSRALIGNFEAKECDCGSLFSAIENDLRKNSINELIGPMNGSTWNEHRFIVDNHGSPFLSEMIHPKYYSTIWEKNNFCVFQSYYSYKDVKLETNAERLSKLSDHFEQLKINVRMIDLGVFEEELAKIYGLCMVSFQKNVLYSEISQERFIASYAPMKNWLNEEYIWLAENEKDECVGFLFAFENKLNATENELIVKTIAKHPSFRYNGLGTLLGNRFMEKAQENHVSAVIHAFMHENNVSKNLSQRFNGEIIRTYGLFSKMINAI